MQDETRADDVAAGLPAELVAPALRRRGRLAVFDRLVPARSALLVIDMQRAWTDPAGPLHIPGTAALIGRINRLAAALRAAGGWVVWVQHTSAPPGAPEHWGLYYENFLSPARRAASLAMFAAGAPLHALDPRLDIRPADARLPKFRFSAFMRNPADPEAMLRARGIDTLVIAGVATDLCCESTAREAMLRDFRVFMPHDAVDAASRAAHLAALGSVLQVFADVRPTAEVLAMIARG